MGFGESTLEDLERLVVKVLVTGATGFIGSHLAERLVNDGYDIVILKRSTSDTKRITPISNRVTFYDLDKNGMKAIVEKEPVDLIIHAATCYGRKGETIEKLIESNITFPSFLIDIALNNGLKGFINADTSTEDTYSLYSSTKKAFLHILNYFHKEKDLKIINLQLEYVYGPGDDDSKFIPLLIKGILNDSPVRASLGIQKRDFIFVEDVVDAFVKAVDFIRKMNKDCISIEIGSGESMSFKKLADILEKLTSKKSIINWGAIDYRKNEIFSLKADLKKAYEFLGWEPKYDLEEGLKKTINWYKKNVEMFL